MIMAEHLVVVKILAGRPKDIEDVRGILLEKSAELNHDSICDLLKQLEEALGQSDLVPSFEELT